MLTTNTEAIVALSVGAIFLSVMFAAGVFDNAIEAPVDRVDAPEASPVPEDFVLTYSHGIGLDYTLTVDNTGNASYNVKMCHVVLPTHATILMSRQEVELMWKSIEENRLFEISEDFTKDCPDFGQCIRIAPASRTVLQVQANGATKTIEFHQNYALNHSNDQLDRLRAAIDMINDVLQGYENLPRSDCAYL